jgi:hypothetical protein
MTFMVGAALQRSLFSLAESLLAPSLTASLRQLLGSRWEATSQGTSLNVRQGRIEVRASVVVRSVTAGSERGRRSRDAVQVGGHAGDDVNSTSRAAAGGTERTRARPLTHPA